MLQHVLENLRLGHLGAVLGGEHHGVNGHRTAVLVAYGDLALAVGAQVGQQALLAHLGQAAGEPVGQGNGHGHQLGGFVAGVAEHHALISRAGLNGVLPLPGFQGRVHAHGDVRALLVDGGHHRAAVAVKAHVRGVVADVQHHLPDDIGDGHIAAGGNFTHHRHHAGGGKGFAGDPGHGVLGQDGVQHRVGDLVAHFVGMAFGNGFGGKESLHGHLPLLSWSWDGKPSAFAFEPQKNRPRCTRLRRDQSH